MANVLLTGASGDIGIETARLFASYGHNLALVGFKNYNQLEEEAKKIAEKYQINCRCFKCDAANPDAVKAVVDETLKSFGTIDLLINNAGMSVVGLDQDLTPEEWLRLCGVNLSSVMYFCRNAVPYMLREHRGRIINISSMWGSRGASCESAYSATKGGVDSYTKALGKELAPSRIPVNAIAFGAIDTKMNAHLSKEEKAVLEEEIPFGRMATSKEAAEMIYLIYQAPAYMTAQVIGFDGGY
jgi:3-oxoacyl-[acyl-carrier protein] reductase